MALGEQAVRSILSFARLDFGEVENIVDDRQQMAGIALDRDHRFLLLRLLHQFAEQIGIAEDRVHGGADFVAHVGQEGAFGAGGRFGRLADFSEA